MPDIFSKSKRSEIMAKIKSKRTKLDLTMKKILDESNISYVMYPKIYGKPDFQIADLAIFCDSSFWHGKNWVKLKKKLEIGNNANYWVKHIQKNRNRDRLVTKKLMLEGYNVVRFWDIDIYKKPELCVEKIKKLLS